MVLVKPARNHKAIGELSQAYITARLIEVGYTVLVPYGDNLRYDLAIEDTDGKIWRIQCKTGWIGKDNAYIEFAVASSYYHTRAGKTAYGSKPYHGQIEYFAIYCPQTSGFYLIPVEHTGVSHMKLRLVSTKNNQEKGVKWAKDYEL